MRTPKAVVIPAVGNTFRVRVGSFVFDRVFQSAAVARRFAAQVKTKNFVQE